MADLWTPLWVGSGMVTSDGRLLLVGADLYALGVTTDDRTTLLAASAPVEKRSDEGEWTCAKILQVNSAQELQLGDVSIHGEVFVRIERAVLVPCGVCARKGQARETDHRHCVRCEAEIATEVARAHCDPCVAWGRKRILADGAFAAEFKLMAGRLTAKLRVRTVEDSDAIQEWQERLAREVPAASFPWKATETNKRALAFTVLDDGKGGCPRSRLVPGGPTGLCEQLDVMVTHFKGMQEFHYQALATALLHLDTLAQEACQGKIDEEFSDEDAKALVEQMCTVPDGEEFTGIVRALDGDLELVFASPTTDALDKANELAEGILQAGYGEMSGDRVTLIVGLFRFAAFFRGDNRVRFGPTSSLKERLDYLKGLPLSLYYHYLRACEAWDRKVRKANNLEMVGNC